MTETTLKQIYSKLNEIDQKVNSLLVKEEKPTKGEMKAIKAGEKQFSQGKFRSWDEIKKTL
ncbi:MAG: hypothetical protein NUV67_04305 [archaeon]|nr:hypothetical protein [archaeon]